MHRFRLMRDPSLPKKTFHSENRSLMDPTFRRLNCAFHPHNLHRFDRKI
jgi:hypothetical protein